MGQQANTKFKRDQKRVANLMPDNKPKYIRAYDNGGESIDRYTVVYTGRYKKDGYETQYVAMNESPFHPQGFGQHGSSRDTIDTNKWGFAPHYGRKNHLGTRIKFEDLPKDCKRLVLQDYADIWDLPLNLVMLGQKELQ